MAIFIDRQLAGPWGRDGHRYTHAPFDENGREEFGYQGAATPSADLSRRAEAARGLRRSRSRRAGRQAQANREGRFFNLLRRNTIEGMFCDPQHGGNVDMVGWQLIGFPGPRMSNYVKRSRNIAARRSGRSR